MQLYKQIISDSKWSKNVHDLVSHQHQAWLPWLLHQGSLTSALIDFSQGEFQVRVLSEHWAKPLAREARKLDLQTHLAVRVREVELLCNGSVVVFARSIIPLALFRSEPHTFIGMGSQPLGHLLFKNGRARYRQRTISQLTRADEAPIYGRATPYQYHGHEILVSEFFLSPDLID